MFRDEGQRARACRALLRVACLGRLWPGERPTEEFFDIAEAGGSPLSSGEGTMVLIAWSLWGSNPGPAFERLFNLDDGNLEAVGSLLAALAGGEAAVDLWIEGHNAAVERQGGGA